jgi:tetratricopeptide (TPR) repeat protein/membrane protease YdiL (CAAX protease family)
MSRPPGRPLGLPRVCMVPAVTADPSRMGAKMEFVAIGLVIFFFIGGGVTVLSKGRIHATRTTVVEGLPARIVGLLLLLAVPLSVVTAIFGHSILGLLGLRPGPDSGLPILVACIALLGCPLLAVIVGMAAAKKSSVPPLPPRFRWPMDEVRPWEPPTHDSGLSPPEPADPDKEKPASEVVIPTVTLFAPRPGLLGALGWSLLLLLGQAVPLVPVIGVIGLTHLESWPVLVLTTASVGLLAATAVIVANLFGNQVRRVLALRQADMVHLLLTVLIVPPLALVALAIAHWTSFGTEATGTVHVTTVATAQGAAHWSFSQQRLFDELSKHSWLVILFVGCVLPAVGEETFSRGFLSRGLVGRYGVIWGTLATAVLFGLMHIEPANIGAATILGIGCQAVFLATRSLLAPILLHTLHNLLVFSVWKLDGWNQIGLVGSDGGVSVPLLTAALAASAGLVVVLYQSRVRWLLPDGKTWDWGYVTAETPPALLAAAPRRGPVRLSGMVPGLVIYLGFAGLLFYRSGLNPHGVQAYTSRGWSAYERGAYDDAIAEYTSAIRSDPKTAWVYSGRGMALGMNRRYDEAVADFTEAIRLDPFTADYWANRAWAYNLKGAYREAVEDCDRAIRLNANLSFAYSERGKARARSGEYDLAMLDCDQAIGLNPRDAEAHEWMGYILNRKGEWGGAIQAFDRALQLNPANAFAYRSRARAYYGKGDFAHALADYTAAIRLNPTSIETLRDRGDLHARKGDFDGALADYDAALGLYPNDVETLRRRCYVHLTRRDYRQAVADSTTALLRNPNDVRCLVYRAWVRATCSEEEYRDGKQAVADARRACELTKWKDADCLHTLAAAHAESEQFEEAVEYEQKAIDLVPEPQREDYLSYLRLYQDGRPYRDEPQ